MKSGSTLKLMYSEPRARWSLYQLWSWRGNRSSVARSPGVPPCPCSPTLDRVFSIKSRCYIAMVLIYISHEKSRKHVPRLPGGGLWRSSFECSVDESINDVLFLVGIRIWPRSGTVSSAGPASPPCWSLPLACRSRRLSRCTVISVA